MSDPVTPAATHTANVVDKAKEVTKEGAMGILALIKFLLEKTGTLIDELGPEMTSASEGTKQVYSAVKKLYLQYKALWSPKIFGFWALWIAFWQLMSAQDVYASGWNGYFWKELMCWIPPGIYVLALYFLQEGLWKVLDLATKLPEKVIKIEFLNEKGSGGIKEEVQAAFRKVFTTLALACCFRIMDHTAIGEFLVFLAASFSFINSYRSMKLERFSVPQEFVETEEETDQVGGKKHTLTLKITEANPVMKFGGDSNVAFLMLMKLFRWTYVSVLLGHTVLFIYTMNVVCGESGVTRAIHKFRGYNPAAVCYNSGTDTVENSWLATLEDFQGNLNGSKLERKIPMLVEKAGNEVFGKNRWVGREFTRNIPNISHEPCLTEPDQRGNQWTTDNCLSLISRSLGARGNEQAARFLDKQPGCWDPTGRIPNLACLANFMPSLSMRSMAQGRMRIATDPKCFMEDGTINTDCLSSLARYRIGIVVNQGGEEFQLIPMDTMTNQSFVGFWDNVFGHYVISYKGSHEVAISDKLVNVLGRALAKQKEEERRAWVGAMTSMYLPDGVEQRIKENTEAMERNLAEQHLPRGLTQHAPENGEFMLWSLALLGAFLVVMGFRKWGVSGAVGMVIMTALMFGAMLMPYEGLRGIGTVFLALIATGLVLVGGEGGGSKPAAKPAAKKKDDGHGHH